MEIANKQELETKMKQMKKLSHVTVKVSVSSMSMMILTKTSRLVQSITIAQEEIFQNRFHVYQMVQQHIRDPFLMLFDLHSRRLINFTLILRHVFPQNLKIQLRKLFEQYNLCAGTVIHKHWILTSATCCKLDDIVTIKFNDYSGMFQLTPKSWTMTHGAWQYRG